MSKYQEYRGLIHQLRGVARIFFRGAKFDLPAERYIIANLILLRVGNNTQLEGDVTRHNTFIIKFLLIHLILPNTSNTFLLIHLINSS